MRIVWVVHYQQGKVAKFSDPIIGIYQNAIDALTWIEEKQNKNKRFFIAKWPLQESIQTDLDRKRKC